MVSIIIPNFNHALYLRQRIDSVLNQTYRDFEVIILDDCSTDNSRELLETYRNHPKVKHLVFNTENSGSPFVQWNKGLALAKGDVIWIAESDDFSDERFLETLLPELADEKVGIAFCSSKWIDDQDNIKEDLSLFHESFKINGQAILANQLFYKCIIQNASSALIRRSVISNYIDKLQEFKYCGDWLFYADVLTRSNLSYVNKKLNYFRWYHNNSSNKAIELGKWTDEGIHVLRFLSKSKLLTIGRCYILYKHWLKRINLVTDVERKRNLMTSLLVYIFLGVVNLPFRKLN